MNNYDKEVFGFGNSKEEDGAFNLNSINGLGESNYENEDLFNTEVEQNDNVSNQTDNKDSENDYNYINSNFDYSNNSDSMFGYNNPIKETNAEDAIPSTPIMSEQPYDFDENGVVTGYSGLNSQNEKTNDGQSVESFDSGIIKDYDNDEKYADVEQKNNQTFEFDKNGVVTGYNIPNDFSQNEISSDNSEEEANETSIKDETPEVLSNIEEPISMSDTDINELNKLTEYKEEDKIEPTNINSLLEKLSENVQDASDIFKKNTEMKSKIDSRFEELKELQAEVENSKKHQMYEIDSYKEEVLTKLTLKKEEIEKRLNTLKDLQASLEKERDEFEQYRKEEKNKIKKVQGEIQNAYDSRREELNHIEDILRKQKDSLDDDRNQLSLDRIKYEADKNELANNLLKFNELVNSFTTGVNVSENNVNE